ncbi:MAG: thiamine phosphate synthase [Bacteroidaceae bacterium]|nr:thiamine phosphate synthase [Bacteroidaceae bacterium]
MKLIVMTQPKFFIEEDKIITALFDEGMETLHIWKPDSLPIYSERLLSLISEEYRKRIYVHEHFYLKDEFNLAGICLADETDEEPHGKGKVCCVCNDINNLKMASKKFEYVLLNGCFTEGGYSEEQLKVASKEKLINKKVFAMGGVSLDQFKFAKDLGFGGVVMMSDLWNKFEIHQQDSYNELIAYFKKIKNILS